jgi:hypothetical protein
MLACLLSWSEHMLAPSWSRENCFVRIFCFLCVCFRYQRFINSNTGGACSGRGGGPTPSLGRCILLPDCSGPEVWPRTTTFQICKWTRTAEFLDNTGKKSSEDRDNGDHISFVHKPRQEVSRGWPSNVSVVGILEAVWCVNETCWVARRESKVLICSSKATSYCSRWNWILEPNQGQQLILTHRLPRDASSSHEGQTWTEMDKAKKNQSARNLQGKGGQMSSWYTEHSPPEGRNGK